MHTFMRCLANDIIPNGLDGDQHTASCWRAFMFVETCDGMRAAVWDIKMRLAKMRPGMALAA